MKFGVSAVGTYLFPPGIHPWEARAEPADILRVAQRADELGYDYISVPEHIIMLDETVNVMGARWSHALIALGVIAGATKHIKLTNGVLVVPYHNPLELAKMLSTLDFLSSGRLIIGVGIGNARREFELLGVSHDDRGPLTDEYLAAMIELWTNDKPRFEGKYVSFDNVVFEPKPIQKPYPPIWVGGNSKAALRRAARVGDGWNSSGIARENMPAMLEYLWGQPGLSERLRPFEVVLSLTGSIVEVGTHRQIQGAPIDTKEQVLEQIESITQVGATATGTPIKRTRSIEEYLEQLQWWAEEIFPFAQG